LAKSRGKIGWSHDTKSENALSQPGIFCPKTLFRDVHGYRFAVEWNKSAEHYYGPDAQSSAFDGVRYALAWANAI
jgi:hypothetical protein